MKKFDPESKTTAWTMFSPSWLRVFSLSKEIWRAVKSRFDNIVDTLPFQNSLGLWSVLGFLSGSSLAFCSLYFIAPYWRLLPLFFFFGLAYFVGVSAEPMVIVGPFGDINDLEAGLGFEMVELPKGGFHMGSPAEAVAEDRERPQHYVEVEAFAISKFIVSRNLYCEVMGGDKQPLEWSENRGQLPANYLTWHDALEFCNELSRRHNLAPCYTWTLKVPRLKPEANGYRLPREAEWEYAARAGNEFGGLQGELPLEDTAWFDDNSESDIHELGLKTANPWGLFDMYGNVWEWCWDLFYDYPTTDEKKRTHHKYLQDRMLRGGAFCCPKSRLRAAFRFGARPSVRDKDIGFRIVRKAQLEFPKFN